MRSIALWVTLKEVNTSGAARPGERQPEGNGVAERFIRTLKETLLWVRYFQTIEELRLALIEFADWYNTRWLVARHHHRIPAQVRADQQPTRDLAT